MYEKIVNYFESNLCVENIYFRRKYILWMVGILATLLIELIINYIVSNFISNIWIRTIVILSIDFLITLVFLILAYALPINKIYKEKIKGKMKIDLVGLLMKEERLSAYREIEIEEMEVFLKKKCKINNIESIKTIIDMISEEIKDKYTKKNFIEKYFNNTILPILILILTIYFTNTNEQSLANILTTTIISIVSIVFTGNFITKLKNINITPVRKKENLLELKRVLMDIKITMQNK
ncbi:unknown [Clostridium sp. CAG:798]|jgi:ABC-type multidrug transport system fused ATPase/permease subunit|nr:unknown [Clostridium sp. CAG:798]